MQVLPLSHNNKPMTQLEGAVVSTLWRAPNKDQILILNLSESQILIQMPQMENYISQSSQICVAKSRHKKCYCLVFTRQIINVH